MSGRRDRKHDVSDHRMEAIPWPDRDARWHDRRADVDRCLEAIYGKEAQAETRGDARRRDASGEPIQFPTPMATHGPSRSIFLRPAIWSARPNSGQITYRRPSIPSLWTLRRAWAWTRRVLHLLPLSRAPASPTIIGSCNPSGTMTLGPKARACGVASSATHRF